MILTLPVTFQLPETNPEPVKIKVSTVENVELPETVRGPLIDTPLDAVTDERCASLPLTISFFQVANYYSILLISGSRLNIYKYEFMIVLVKL